LAIEKIHIEQFLQLGQLYPVLDVRSPGEFNHAHIQAYSLPLFSDEERKVVGTAYKQQSREAAIKLVWIFLAQKCGPWWRKWRG
jgi:tRNA 2-selenouridine synthase